MIVCYLLVLLASALTSKYGILAMSTTRCHPTFRIRPPNIVRLNFYVLRAIRYIFDKVWYC